MKKWITRILTASIVLAIVVVSYFVFSTNETDLLNKVPSDAKTVVVIDLKGLLAKLFFDELTNDEKNADKLVKLVPDSLIDIDWSKSGINLLDMAVLFTTEDKSTGNVRINLLLPVSNDLELNRFIDSVANNIKLEINRNGENNTAYYKPYRLLVGWNKNFIIGTYNSDNQENDRQAITQILSSRDEKSILGDSSFVKNLNVSYDVMAYSMPSAIYPGKSQQFIEANIESVSSFIRLNDGELEIEMILKPNPKSSLDQLFNQQKKEIASIENSDSSIFNVHFDINPAAFFKMLTQYSSIKFNKEKVPALLAWDGSANFIINKSKIIENEYISYDYDDDFNKIEIRKTEKEKIIDIQTIMGLKQKKLDSILSKNQAIKSKNDTLLFKGSNYVMKKSGKAYLCYNRFVDRPGLKQQPKNDNISATINFKSLLQLLKEHTIINDSSILYKFPFENIEIAVNKKDGIKLNGKIYFTDKQKNAFFSLTENFE